MIKQEHVSARATLRRTLLVGLALLAMLLVAAPQAAHAQTAQLRVFGQTRYVNGVNMAWIRNAAGSDYAHDLGTNPVSGYTCRYNGTEVENYFRDMRNMRCNVVRVWLFEGMEGLTFDGNGYVNGLDGTFKSNLNNLLSAAWRQGMSVELTLLNHDANEQFGARARNGATVKNFLTDNVAQQAFLNNAVNPLINDCVTWIDGNGKHQIKQEFFGFDIMNEVNYAISPYNGKPPLCNWSQMHSFLYNVAGRIHQLQPSIQVGCATDNADDFSNANHWNRLGGIGLNYYGYHNYNDAPNLFPKNDASKTIDKPLLLEECNARTTWNESTQASAIDSYINQAASKGYAGALAWNYDTLGDSAYAVNRGPGNWKAAAWKIQWWGQHFGL